MDFHFSNIFFSSHPRDYKYAHRKSCWEYSFFISHLSPLEYSPFWSIFMLFAFQLKIMCIPPHANDSIFLHGSQLFSLLPVQVLIPLLNSSSLTLALFSLFSLFQKKYIKKRPSPLYSPLSLPRSLRSLGISTIAHYVRLV